MLLTITKPKDVYLATPIALGVLVLVAFVLFMLVLIWSIIDYRKTQIKDFEMIPVLVILGLFLFGFSSLFIITTKDRITYEKWYETRYKETLYDSIYSLNVDNDTEEQFILGAGSVDTNTYYYFCSKGESGIYKLERIQCENVVIKESIKSPKIIQIKEANSKDIITIIFVPAGTIIKPYFAIGF